MKPMTTVGFRCDGGPGVGGGHVMRCLVLADAFAAAGSRVVFFVSAVTPDSVPALIRSGHEIVKIPGVPSEELSTIRERLQGGCAAFVIDHYGLGADYEAALLPRADTLVAFEDDGDRSHRAHVLIELGSADRVAPAEEPVRLVGPRFALIRSSLRVRRDNALPCRSTPARSILVSFGMIDSRNATGVALAALAGIRSCLAIDVVLGPGAPHRASVETQAARDSRVRLHYAPEDFDEMLATCDMAIGAGGVLALERACLGVPSVALETAANQRAGLAILAQAGALLHAGEAPVSPSSLAEAINTLLNDGSRRAEMAAAAMTLVDGEGANRIVQAVQRRASA